MPGLLLHQIGVTGTELGAGRTLDEVLQPDQRYRSRKRPQVYLDAGDGSLPGLALDDGFVSPIKNPPKPRRRQFVLEPNADYMQGCTGDGDDGLWVMIPGLVQKPQPPLQLWEEVVPQPRALAEELAPAQRNRHYRPRRSPSDRPPLDDQALFGRPIDDLILPDAKSRYRPRRSIERLFYWEVRLPQTVVDLRAHIIAGPTVRLNWTDGGGETSFDVQRSDVTTAGAFASIGNVLEGVQTYDDVGPFTSGHIYQYRLKINGGGLDGTFSNTVIALRRGSHIRRVMRWGL